MVERMAVGADTDTQAGQGVTPSRLRNHNERAMLTKLREHGALASAELARILNVSAQTASVITRALEKDGLILKGQPVKGKVGKPQVPVALHPDGAFAFGVQIGRRGADLILMDLAGNTRQHDRISYKYPAPAIIEDFVRDRVASACKDMSDESRRRIVGLGIATPFELWNWLEALGAPAAEADLWRDYDFSGRLGPATGLRVTVANDANMACNGELVFGAGRAHRDFVYIYVGAFVGGGIALNGQLFHGAHGNAGAIGSIPVGPVEEPDHQLIHHASLYTLEKTISDKLGRPVNLRIETEHWADAPVDVATWIDSTGRALAKAAITVNAVLDIDTVVLDGGFPPEIRSRVAERMTSAMADIDQQGLNPMTVQEGALGRRAGAMGAAFQPLLSAHFLEGSQLL